MKKNCSIELIYIQGNSTFVARIYRLVTSVSLGEFSTKPEIEYLIEGDSYGISN